MKRREFLGMLGGAAVAWPRAATAQQPEKMRTIGMLIGGTADRPEHQARVEALLQAGAKHGIRRAGGLHTLYISPLKALAVDIARNL